MSTHLSSRAFPVAQVRRSLGRSSPEALRRSSGVTGWQVPPLPDVQGPTCAGVSGYHRRFDGAICGAPASRRDPLRQVSLRLRHQAAPLPNELCGPSGRGASMCSQERGVGELSLAGGRCFMPDWMEITRLRTMRPACAMQCKHFTAFVRPCSSVKFRQPQPFRMNIVYSCFTKRGGTTIAIGCTLTAGAESTQALAADAACSWRVAFLSRCMC